MVASAGDPSAPRPPAVCSGHRLPLFRAGGSGATPPDGVPQPNGGRALRWRGRDRHHTIVGPGRARESATEIGVTRLLAGARGRPGRRAPGPAGHGGQRPPADPGRHPVHHRRHRRAGPGPRHLGRAGHPDHRRQPLRPHRLRRAAGGGRAVPRRPSGAGPGPDPVPDRRRATGHPPDRHPRAGLSTPTPMPVAASGGAGGRAARPDRPPPPDGHRGPGGAGRARRARLRPGGRLPRDRVRPGRRRQARGHRPLAGGTGLAVAGRPVRGGRAVAGRAQPPERPLGAVPVRGLPHPLPAARPLRLVAAGALRRGRPAAGGRHPVGARAISGRACRAGPSATPTRPTSATRWSSPPRCRWSCWPCWPWCSAC